MTSSLVHQMKIQIKDIGSPTKKALLWPFLVCK